MNYENIMREFERNGVDFCDSPKELKQAACAFANSNLTEFGDFLEQWLEEQRAIAEEQKSIDALEDIRQDA